MKRASLACCAVLALSAISLVQAQSQTTSSERSGGGVYLENLIAQVAKKTSKKFIVDPRVRAEISLIGENISNVDYPTLLTILETYNFAAVESGGYVRVIPVADARNLPVPTVVGNKEYPDSEVVSKVIPVKSVPVAAILQAVRPIIPNYAHLGLVSCSNTLILVDRYANVKRVSALIESLDKGEPLKQISCSAEEPKKQTDK